MNKPMSVLRKEFMDKVVEDVNTSGLPLCVVEPILKDLHSVVQREAELQYQKEKMAYEAALKQEAEESEPETE